MKSKFLLLILSLYLASPLMGCGNKGGGTSNTPFPFPSGASGLPFGAGGAGGPGGSTPNATEQQLTGDWISDKTTNDGDRVILNFNFSGGERLATAKTLQVTGITSIVSAGSYEVKDNNLTLKLTFTTYQAALVLKTNPDELWIGSEKYTRLAGIDSPSISGQIHVAEDQSNSTVQVSSTPYAMDQVFVKYKKMGSKAALTLSGSASSTYVPVKISEVTSQKPELQALTVQKLVTTSQDGDLSQFVSNQHLLDKKKVEHFNQVVEALKADPNVESVSLNHLVRAQGGADPDVAKQTNLAAIQAPEAWGLVDSQGAGNQVVVAVVDNGVHYDHPDLTDHILKDKNGKVVGYDFVEDVEFTDPGNSKKYTFDQADTQKGSEDDPLDPGDSWNIPGSTDGNSWHGTHVSGAIAAVRNNGTGISGLADNVKIMPLRAIGWHGYGDINFIINAINYAAQLTNPIDCPNGKCDFKGRPLANIINLSLGYEMKYSEAKSLMEAINNATKKGILVVAAAGNAGQSYSIPKQDAAKKDSDVGFFPGAGENVLTVGSIGTNGSKALSSNYGPYVDIYAPGEKIYSTTWYINPANKADSKADYGVRSGTSQATPQVTGVAALVYGKKTISDLNGVNSVKDTLKKNSASLSGADLAAGSCDAGSQPATPVGAGLLKAYYTLVDAWKVAANALPTLKVKATDVQFGPYGSYAVVGIDNLGTKPITDLSWSLKNLSVPTGVTGDPKWFTVTLDAAGCKSIAKSASLKFKANRKGLPVGTYQGQVTVSSIAGTGTITVELEVKESIDTKGLLGAIGDLNNQDDQTDGGGSGDTGTTGTDNQDQFDNTVDVGDFYVLLIDQTSGQPISNIAKTGLPSNYFFMILDVPPGTYQVLAGVDTNNDGHICDLKATNPEPCTAYPDLVQVKTGTHVEDLVINY